MQTLCWMVYWVEQDHWLRQFPGSKLGTDWRYFPGSCDLDRAQFSRWPVWNKWVYLYVAADCSQPRRSKYTRSAHVQRHTRLSCCLPMRPSATRRRCKSAQNDILVPNDQPTPTAPAHYHTTRHLGHKIRARSRLHYQTYSEHGIMLYYNVVRAWCLRRMPGDALIIVAV